MAIRKRKLLILSLLAVFVSTPAAYGDVWQRRGDGELTLHRTLDYFQRQRLAGNWRPPTAAVLNTRRQEYAAIIDQLANRYGVDAALVRAIIEVESAYDTHAVSKAGAQGLMQLMPKTVERFAVVDPLDPQQNIEAGVRYLQILIVEFQKPELVLAAYNAGEAAVRRYGNRIPPYAETRAYVDRVLSVMHRQDVSAQ